MTEETQTPVEQEKELLGKFLIGIDLEDGDMDTIVQITGISNVEILGLITYVRNILDDLEYDMLEKLNKVSE
jgi:hypothetical protein